MDYGGVHKAAKFAAIPTVIGFLLYMWSWQLMIYVFVFSTVSYIAVKSRAVKE